MSVLIQIIGPKKKKHNFHLQNWRTPICSRVLDVLTDITPSCCEDTFSRGRQSAIAEARALYGMLGRLLFLGVQTNGLATSLTRLRSALLGSPNIRRD